MEQIKKDVEAKDSQVADCLNQIKESNQENIQLKQTINELEQKKIELTTKLHSSNEPREPTETDSNESHERLINLIKVMLIVRLCDKQNLSK